MRATTGSHYGYLLNGKSESYCKLAGYFILARSVLQSIFTKSSQNLYTDEVAQDKEEFIEVAGHRNAIVL